MAMLQDGERNSVDDAWQIWQNRYRRVGDLSGFGDASLDWNGGGIWGDVEEDDEGLVVFLVLLDRSCGEGGSEVRLEGRGISEKMSVFF
ncbi:hypothetical protein GBA52_004019 [Prunus armeniaca]|nr:hypothetical protein GBA52_004019 [Prunus armeniaca]